MVGSVKASPDGGGVMRVLNKFEDVEPEQLRMIISGIATYLGVSEKVVLKQLEYAHKRRSYREKAAEGSD